MVTRLPLLKKAQDFWSFFEVGRKLADIHLNYEEQNPPKEVLINGKPLPKSPFPSEQLIVNNRNDPNNWATEHNDPQYILNLLFISFTI